MNFALLLTIALESTDLYHTDLGSNILKNTYICSVDIYFLWHKTKKEEDGKLLVILKFQKSPLTVSFAYDIS